MLPLTGCRRCRRPAAMANSMKEFDVKQLLGKGSYGSVFKCKRKSDGMM